MANNDDGVNSATLATILACFTLGSLLCGVVLIVLALFPKVAKLLHYLPLPVLGGFLASIGLFIFLGLLHAGVRNVDA
jgi:MFS superfamily sulfate permease-like transporter